VTLERKATGRDKDKNFSKSSRVKKTDELVKVINNFIGVVTSGFGPDVAFGPPVRPRWSKR
jgi:hypothetical protein